MPIIFKNIKKYNSFMLPKKEAKLFAVEIGNIFLVKITTNSANFGMQNIEDNENIVIFNIFFII